MSFGDFLKNIGQTFKPPERIRDWRKLKRQYRAYLKDLGQDEKAVRQGVRAWVKNNPKPRRTKKKERKYTAIYRNFIEKGVTSLAVMVFAVVRMALTRLLLWEQTQKQDLQGLILCYYCC